MKIRYKFFLSSPQLAKGLRAVLLSSALAAVVLAVFPWLQKAWGVFRVIAAGVLWPRHVWIWALVGGIAAAGSLALLLGPRVWKSLRLGLFSPAYHLWIIAFALFGVLVSKVHFVAAFLTVIIAGILTYLAAALLRPSLPIDPIDDPTDPDLPVAEDGTDLLDRGQVINGLVSIVLREQPSVIALIGGYGDGKTSLLNLTIGKLKKLDSGQQPLIVKFSPWLPANSNALVISLLSSIVAEIRKTYVMPGLSTGVLQYARALITVVPKAKVIEAFLNEPSQQERVRRMAQEIAKMPRRIVVILDDLDRMEAKELETVFKILRGSDNLSSVTFICSFDEGELALILKSGRRFQDTRKFIDKFFQTKLMLAKIESSQIKAIFENQITHLAHNLFPNSVRKSFRNWWISSGKAEGNSTSQIFEV